MIDPRQRFVWYGGEYYPEQWDEETFKKDLEWMKQARMDIVTIGVFCWSLIQPEEDRYDFTYLDRTLEIFEKEGFYVCLATPTAAPPLWMVRKYPDILAVDMNGHRKTPGGRANFCPNSEKYREFSANMAEKLAERYKDYKPLVLWHVNNEYSNYCYCETCAEKFREWLKNRYKTLEEFNRAWYADFWGQRVYDWQEIPTPTTRNFLMFRKDRFQSINPAAYQDYRRFMNESLLECFELEYRAIKRHTPNVPVTTNIMATFKPLDYFEWAKRMDIVSWDSYPDYGEDHAKVSMRHALVRGLAGGKTFVLMEQSPSQAIWKWYNHQKSEEALRLHTFQSLAHGAEAALYFQIRQSRGGCERFHGAVITHADSNDTRVFNAVKRVGEDLKKLQDKVLNTHVVSKVGVLFDWNSWWALEDSPGPNIDFTYLQELEKYYRALLRWGVGVDVVSVEEDFSKYKIIFGPALFMVDKKTAEKIENYVKSGGIFVATTMSGISDENSLVWLGGYLAGLREVFGVRIEEFDAFPPNEERTVEFLNKKYSVKLLEALVRVERAETLGWYVDGLYANRACITANKYAKGVAYYVGACASQQLANDFVSYLISEHDLESFCREPIDGIEIVEKKRSTGEKLLFILNFDRVGKKMDIGGGSWRDLLSGKIFQGEISIGPEDVLVLEEID
ncbi:beta-galactosidase [Pseudothermotoga sp.]|uniref:beta-galactosidase n=1 Tax=Pseudothermotoga sp. TaxID=2033661 RepID=UPI0031F6BF3C